MARQFFKDLPDTSTPLTASRLNGLLDGEEVLGNLVVDSIKTKNIFVGIIEQGSFLPSTGEPVSGTTRIRSASFTNVKAGNKTISLYNNNNFDVVVYVYDIDGTWKSSESITDWQSLPYTINIQGERKIKIAIRNKNNSTIVPSDVQNVQIEEGDTATTYSPFQELDAQNIGNYWQDKTSGITIKNSNVQVQRTKLFVNEALRLVFLQVYYTANVNGTVADIIEYPLTYKPAFSNSDDIWINMMYSNGGNAPDIRGAIKFDSSKCFVDLLCTNATASSAFGNIIYPY